MKDIGVHLVIRELQELTHVRKNELLDASYIYLVV